MSKKYEHKIENLKKHTKDKKGGDKSSKRRYNRKNKKLGAYKKEQADFNKKMKKSKEIW